jgi:[protein-PII] uridylyltransferase
MLYPPALISELRDRHRAGRESLDNAFRVGLSVSIYLRRSSRCVDRLLQALWKRLPPSVTRHACLVAVGGYGRDQLYPHSDVDIMALCDAPFENETRDALVEFETVLWDLGLDIGHRVHALAEFEGFQKFDIATQTAMLENRLVAGSKKLHAAFQKELRERFDFPAFFDAKQFEQEQRYLKYKDVVYNLEPNVKEGPGGLRDIHVIRWIERAAHLNASRNPLTRKLFNAEFLTPREMNILKREEKLVQSLRVCVHLLAKREEDRLLFDYQNSLASILKIEATPARLPGEVLMQRYYRAAQRIRCLNMLFMQTVSEFLRPLPITRALDVFFLQRGRLLDIYDKKLFLSHPGAILDTFLHWQRNPEIQTLSANTLRALGEAAHLINRRFRNDPENRAKFVAFFKGGNAITHATRIMNLFGILGKYLPEFGRIVGMMQHDLFHIYTVDEHTLLVVRNLRRYSLNAHAHEYPLPSRLMMDFDRKETLYFAALFHDIGKGMGSDHSELGGGIARQFCRRHHLPKEDSDLIVWLVRMHLKMSRISQKQDISDPEVISKFAELCGDERHLAALFLLTTCDIRATSPKIWTPWRAQLLESLYLATRARFHQQSLYDSLESKQKAAREAIRNRLPENIELPLWRSLDATYFQRHTVDELVWHVKELAPKWHSETPVVAARILPKKTGLQFLIYMRDMPGLFARIAAFFSMKQLNVSVARIHTTRDGYALDSFIVQTQDAYLLSDPGEVDELAKKLQDYLSGDQKIPTPPLGKQSRRLRHYPLPPQVRITSGGAEHDYVLEITVGDREGLLARIAAAFVELGVAVKSAHINTMDERVEDVFVLDSATLQNEETRARLEVKLISMLSA